jgi:hypothetical protein
MKTTVTMSQKLYIDPQGAKFAVAVNQDHIIKDDWTLCVRKEDGEYANNYNLDGTPAPDPAPLPEQVDSEADNRVEAVLPLRKQLNYLATDLSYTKRGNGNASLTAEEVSKRTEIEAAWATIEGIRAKAEDIKAMTPIPQDFRDDSYWV